MMFLLRAAFWIGVVLLVLPIGPGDGPRISAFQAYEAASAAVDDLSGFCDRKPEACAVGGEALRTVSERARYGAKLVYDALSDEQVGEEHPLPAVATVETEEVVTPEASGSTGSVGAKPAAMAVAGNKAAEPALIAPLPRPAPAHDTLTEADRLAG